MTITTTTLIWYRHVLPSRTLWESCVRKLRSAQICCSSAVDRKVEDISRPKRVRFPLISNMVDVTVSIRVRNLSILDIRNIRRFSQAEYPEYIQPINCLHHEYTDINCCASGSYNSFFKKTAIRHDNKIKFSLNEYWLYLVQILWQGIRNGIGCGWRLSNKNTMPQDQIF